MSSVPAVGFGEADALGAVICFERPGPSCVIRASALWLLPTVVFAMVFCMVRSIFRDPAVPLLWWLWSLLSSVLAPESPACD